MCGLCFFRFSGNNKRVCRAHAAHSVAQCFPSTSILGIKCLLLPLRGEKAFPQLPTSWKLSPSPPPAPPMLTSYYFLALLGNYGQDGVWRDSPAGVWLPPAWSLPPPWLSLSLALPFLPPVSQASLFTLLLPTSSFSIPVAVGPAASWALQCSWEDRPGGGAAPCLFSPASYFLCPHPHR